MACAHKPVCLVRAMRVAYAPKEPIVSFPYLQAVADLARGGIELLQCNLAGADASCLSPTVARLAGWANCAHPNQIPDRAGGAAQRSALNQP
jgi:hypothetical protein